MGHYDVEVFGVVRQRGYLVEGVDLSNVPADKLVGGVAVVVTHLVHSPAALPYRYRIPGLGGGQHSFLQS